MRIRSLTIGAAALAACAAVTFSVVPAGAASALPGTRANVQSTGSSTLELTSKGPAVTAYQKQLNRAITLHHLYTRPVPVTGYFGTRTRLATLDLQAQRDLARDGKAGRQTKAALAKLQIRVNQGALRVVLRPDGLGLLDPKTTHITDATFTNTDAREITRLVTIALGSATGSFSDDCGNTNVTYRGITLLVRGNDFIGWDTDNHDLSNDLNTSVGTTVAELGQDHPVRFTRIPGNVTVAFTNDSETGYATGTRSSDRVTALRAGDACLAQ